MIVEILQMYAGRSLHTDTAKNLEQRLAKTVRVHETESIPWLKEQRLLVGVYRSGEVRANIQVDNCAESWKLLQPIWKLYAV